MNAPAFVIFWRIGPLGKEYMPGLLGHVATMIVPTFGHRENAMFL